MTHTHEFEHLLAEPHVRGVSYEAAEDTVVIMVGAAADEDALASRIDDHDVTIVTIGQPSPELISGVPEFTLGEAQTERERVRPVEAGLSEINAASTAGTGGLPARVVSPDRVHAEWAATIESGDIVRVSNAHVYGDTADSIGESILQPSPYDGGRQPDDAVGSCVGLCSLGHPRVDAAARSVDADADADDVSRAVADLGVPDGIYRDDRAALQGESVVKSGRTTDITTGEIIATDATISVNYYAAGTIVKRGQLLATDMSEGGDSGSPLLLGTPDDPGAVVGHVFAGSDTITVANPIRAVERELGVQFLAAPDDGETAETGDETEGSNPDETPDEPIPPGATFEEAVHHLLFDAFGASAVSQQHVFPESGRRVDYRIVSGDERYVLERAPVATDLPEALGQALLYAGHDDGYDPIVVMPDGASSSPEREYAARHAHVLEVSDLADWLATRENESTT